ncbi:phosphate:Na+ symporter [Alkalibaculum bacchi]|uniref:Phosphate:Na+ symporter n=1 Tax=Alkalibaculum bacchi TaxID=645887 RepID=A0A366I9F0_9FIRM|nr:Na/Pi cotransporter family protein [Alkalibaculum bacchi]RBP65971.1 phosphate:Na+ symporter [Alkalibaculum bacchi]
MTLEMTIGLIGGLGLFIYGMNLMSDGLKSVAGDRMKRLLEILTNNRIMAIFVGTVVTMIVQSSSTTTVMIVGFVNAGLMNLMQAAGVILGANIGTTITAQLIAFDIAGIAPLFIGIGVLVSLFAKKKRSRQIGGIILGFGILFVGINTMSDVMRPLRDNQGFIDILISFGQNPLLGLLAGAGITAIIQSSSATVGLLQAVAISGAFDGIAGTSPLAIIIPIILGVNIGTCATALLSCIGTSVTAKKAAIIHLFVNISGSICMMILLGVLNSLTNGNNPFYEFLTAISGSRQNIPDINRQIANFHTIFNTSNMLILLPFMTPMVRFIDRLLPDQINPEELRVQFDERMMQNPSIAIGQLVKEVVRMGSLANKNLAQSVDALLNKDEVLSEKVRTREKLVNEFEKDITEYLVLLSNKSLSEKENNRVLNLYNCIHNIERISDHADNLAELAQYRIDNKVSFSHTAVDELKIMMSTVIETSQNAIKAIETYDRSMAVKVLKKEEEINTMEEQLRTGHIDRLNKQICKPATGVIFLDIIGNLERIGDHATNIAELILD